MTWNPRSIRNPSSSRSLRTRPPTCRSASSTRTGTPARCSSRAQQRPAKPAPTTTTGAARSLILISLGWRSGNAPGAVVSMDRDREVTHELLQWTQRLRTRSIQSRYHSSLMPRLVSTFASRYAKPLASIVRFMVMGHSTGHPHDDVRRCSDSYPERKKILAPRDAGPATCAILSAYEHMC